MKINRSVPIRKWIILILSVRLVPIVQSTYLDSYQENYQNYNQQNSPQSNLTALESIQDETYVQNRDQVFLNHLNQLNYDGRNLFNYGNINNLNRQYKRVQQPTYQNSTDEHLAGKSNVLTKRIALSALANIFGGNSEEEEKKVEKQADNQTDKSQPMKNITLIDDLNKNVTNSSLDSNQSTLLKNHLQNDRDIEALNRLINFSKNYENWSDHLKNPYNLNHHRQDLINLLGLNDSNLSDSISSNATELQDQPKNKFAFSPEYAGKAMFENNSNFGFKPNNFLSSLLANPNNEHEYLIPRFNKLTSSLNPTEAITEASDQNVSEYEDTNRDEEDDGQLVKLIDNRNESAVNGKNGERRRKVFRNQQNRMRQGGQRPRQRAKIRKIYDNHNYPYSNKNVAQSGFRPIDNKLLKEQSQISASTGVKRNRNYKSKNLVDLSLVESTQQHQNDNNSNSKKRGNQSASSLEPEYHQLSISNQPYTLRQPNYRFPSGLYGKRLVNEIMNSQPNVRKTLVSTTNNKNSVVNNESASDHLDEENNETGRREEETLNEQDKQLVTDKTKEFYEKNEEDLSELPVDELDNRDLDRDNRDRGTSNEQTSNQQQQQLNHQTNQQQQLNTQQHQNNQQVDTQLNQPILANQLGNQPETETNENDSTENENESLNSTATLTKESDNQEATGKTKLMIGDLNKSTKQDKNSSKSKQKQNNNKMNWKSFYQNYKHHDIYDKYSKLGKNSFNFDQDIPMSAYLSNENFKINLSGGKSDLDDDLTGFPYPNVQYNGKPTFGSPYYPMLKKKPSYFGSYPYPGFSSNPLNGMLFDKLSMPVIDSYAIEKLPAPSLTNTIKGALDKPLDNKFYNLENKLHHLNSKYSLNSLSPPPYALPPHLESTKYYEPKTHHDSKYHNLNHWTSPMITGFLLGVVPFSFLLASMAPTISAITR